MEVGVSLTGVVEAGSGVDQPPQRHQAEVGAQYQHADVQHLGVWCVCLAGIYLGQAGDVVVARSVLLEILLYLHVRRMYTCPS